MKIVMIIEDDEDIREILKETLELESYKVEIAVNGQDALDKLSQSKVLPDLILLDLMMPVMNGWEFSLAAQKDSRLSKIPIIVVSAYVDQAENIKCEGFIEKPIILNDLLNVLRSHLK